MIGKNQYISISASSLSLSCCRFAAEESGRLELYVQTGREKHIPAGVGISGTKENIRKEENVIYAETDRNEKNSVDLYDGSDPSCGGSDPVDGSEG